MLIARACSESSGGTGLYWDKGLTWVTRCCWRRSSKSSDALVEDGSLSMAKLLGRRSLRSSHVC